MGRFSRRHAGRLAGTGVLLSALGVGCADEGVAGYTAVEHPTVGSSADPTATPVPATATPVPATPTPEPTPIPDPSIVVSPQELRQGSTLLVRVDSASSQRVLCTFDGREHTLTRDGNTFIGLFGVHRMATLGLRPLRFVLEDGAGKTRVLEDAAHAVQVVDAQYPIVNLVVEQGTANLLDTAKINQEEALLNGIFGRWSPDRRWSGTFVAPVVGQRISSVFGERRSINGGPANWAHEGTDYAANAGVPVKASAAGRVVFAGPLHVRGNVVVIDHGWSVMTGYFHMSELRAAEGQEVAQGDLIGLVGSTGFSTGPHLHVEVRVRNQFVEPLEWFDQGSFKRPDLAAL